MGLAGARGFAGRGAEADFEDIAEAALAMQLDATTQVAPVCGGKGDAGVNGGFRIGGRFAEH